MGGGGDAVGSGGGVVLRLPAGVMDGLEREAKRARKPVAALLAGVLEDLADARAADAAWKRHGKSGGKTYSMEEVLG